MTAAHLWSLGPETPGAHGCTHLVANCCRGRVCIHGVCCTHGHVCHACWETKCPETLGEKLRAMLPRLERALARAIDEHGVPNRFTPGELAAYYGAPPAVHHGRLARCVHLEGCAVAYDKGWKVAELNGLVVPAADPASEP